MAFLLDTNIISETRRSGRSQIVMNWVASLAVNEIWTCTANLAELEYGAAIESDVLRRKSIEAWILTTVRPWFDNRIQQVDESALQRWLLLLKRAQKDQLPTPHVDLLLAAVALDKGMTIATRDIAPFVVAGVPTLNPFTGERFNGA